MGENFEFFCLGGNEKGDLGEFPTKRRVVVEKFARRGGVEMDTCVSYARVELGRVGPISAMIDGHI